MVVGCHELHKVVLYHISIFTGQGTLHIGVDDALLCDLLADIMVDELGVVLGTHAGEGGALRLRDPELFEGLNMDNIATYVRANTKMKGDWSGTFIS